MTYYQLMHTVRDPIPQQLHLLAEASRSYVPGHQYKAYVAQKSASTKPNMEENLKPYYFIPYSSSGSVISGPLGLDYRFPLYFFSTLILSYDIYTAKPASFEIRFLNMVKQNLAPFIFILLLYIIKKFYM